MSRRDSFQIVQILHTGCNLDPLQPTCDRVRRHLSWFLFRFAHNNLIIEVRCTGMQITFVLVRLIGYHIIWHVCHCCWLLSCRKAILYFHAPCNLRKSNANMSEGIPTLVFSSQRQLNSLARIVLRSAKMAKTLLEDQVKTST